MTDRTFRRRCSSDYHFLAHDAPPGTDLGKAAAILMADMTFRRTLLSLHHIMADITLPDLPACPVFQQCHLIRDVFKHIAALMAERAFCRRQNADIDIAADFALPGPDISEFFRPEVSNHFTCSCIVFYGIFLIFRRLQITVLLIPSASSPSRSLRSVYCVCSIFSARSLSSFP